MKKASGAAGVLLAALAAVCALGIVTARGGGVLDLSNIARMAFCGGAVAFASAAAIVWKVEDARRRKWKLAAWLAAIVFIAAVTAVCSADWTPAVELAR